jgi:hypothetical protein
VGLVELDVSLHVAYESLPLSDAARAWLDDFVLPQLRTVAREDVPALNDEEWMRWRAISDRTSPEYLPVAPNYFLSAVAVCSTARVPVSRLPSTSRGTEGPRLASTRNSQSRAR